MQIQFHGAAQEVGRSCIEITCDDGDRYLLDVGIKFGEQGLLFPENVLDIKEVDGVFLSHAHLDHSGGLPLFEHKELEGPIFSTRQTLAISRILLKDSYKVARIRHQHPAYTNGDIKEVYKDALFVKYDKWYSHRNIRFKFFNAGHIPGSAMVLLEIEGKRILYTGDFNTRQSELMYKAHTNNELTKKHIDVLISESTYGHRELPDRNILEKQLLDSIQKTLKKGGSVLIPTFALGRAQEILLILSKRNWDVPIFTDGMSNKITRKILANKSKYVRNKQTLHDMFYQKVHWIGSQKKRTDAIKKQGIFITTSGMMQGGPVMTYMEQMWSNPKNKVALMGFQVKGTNGRHLYEDGYVYINNVRTRVKCEVEKYDFSGHADVDGIKGFIKEINPKKIFFQHGDKEGVSTLKDWAHKNLKSKVHAPKLGSTYKI